MDTGQAFQPMTSYLQKVAIHDGLTGDTSSSHIKLYSSRHPHPHPQDCLVVQYPQRPYTTVIQESYSHHATYIMQQPHMAQSSQQRVHDPDDLPDRSMEYSPYMEDHSGGNTSHAHASYDHRDEHRPGERYPKPPEPTSASPYPNSLDTPFPLDDQHQPRENESLVNYRQALRGHHDVQSNTLDDRRQRHHEDAPRDDHGHFHQRHVSSSSPPPYIQSFADDAKDRDGSRRSVPYHPNIPRIHPSSSIPMSNRLSPPSLARQTHPEMEFEPDRNQNLLLRRDDLEDTGKHRQAHHSQSRSRIRHRNGSPLSTFYSSTSEHDNNRRIASSSSVSDSHPSPASLPPKQHQHHAQPHSLFTRSRSTPEPPSRSHDHLRRSSASPSHSYDDQHRQQSISSHARSRDQHARSTLFYPDYEKSQPNEDRLSGDPYSRDIPMDVHPHTSSTSLDVPNQTDGQIFRSQSDMGMRSSTDSISASGVGFGDMSSDPGQGPVPIKKKKKSKMHECGICQKKFPRPSGLKTHMNTHNNEKPYPCGFPGCTRTFGVRSNAKRHLRTHGVIPHPAVPPGQMPYIVDFETPVILPHHLPDGHDYSQGRGLSDTEGPRGESYSMSHQMRGEGGNDDSGRPVSQNLLQGGSVSRGQMHLGAEGHRPAPRIPTYKVRWMPPSLTGRKNAQDLREVADGDEQGHEQGQMEHDRDNDYGHNFEDRYPLNVRHDYDHVYEHDEERGHAQEREYDHAIYHANSRPIMREKSRWREGGEGGPSSSGRELEYDQNFQHEEVENDYLDPQVSHSRMRLPLYQQSHLPSMDPDHSLSPPNVLPSRPGSGPAPNTVLTGPTLSSVSFQSRTCICSPPCPVGPSGSILCRLLEIRDG